MIQNASFRRKVIYMAMIALLLIPLYTIGNPATGDPTDPDSTPGGKLSQLRAEYDLAQAELGEIDPASESMKLATLGLRGVATNILWTKANEYKRKENWEGLVAVVNQMAKLQPNFISVWEFQSHNLSYNISVEHDDYRFRYLWVKKGIEFLIEGTRYNRLEPRLFHSLGWYTGQKFGRSDERRQFRPLFADDSDFHAVLDDHVPINTEGLGPGGKPDNWKTSKLWFRKAYNLLDTEDVTLRGKSSHIFFADGPKAQMNYATDLEAEGYFGERAETEWRLAGTEWENEFGQRLVPTSWGEYIRLADEERKREEAAQLVKELDELVPGAREQIRQEKRARLSDEEREAMDSERTAANYALQMQAAFKTFVTHREVADRAPKDMLSKAHRLANRAVATELTAQRIDRYRENVNYEYWRTRCAVEQDPGTVRARKHVYEANRLVEEGVLESALDEYELAWKEWAQTFELYPELVQVEMADDLMDEIQGYEELLGHLDEEVPEDFPLQNIRAILQAGAAEPAEEEADLISAPTP